MAFEIIWYFNISTGNFIKSLSEPSAINPPPLVAGDTPTVSIIFCRDGTEPGTVEKITSSTAVLVSIAATRGGTVATSATCTGPDDESRYSVILPLGVSGVADIATARGAGAVIEFKTGTPYTSYHGNVTIYSKVSDGATDPTPAPDVGLGVQAAWATFMPRDATADPRPGALTPTRQIVIARDGSQWLIEYDENCQEVKEKIS